MLKALVLDAHSRAAVEAIQSLGRRGIHVDAAGTGDCLAFLSRRVRNKIQQPLAEHPEQFIQWLRELDGVHGYSLIVPSTEISLLPLSQVDDQDPLKIKAALPCRTALATALDKYLTIALAQRLGIPVPATVFVESIERVQAVQSFPVVLKPVASKVLRGGKLWGVAPKVVRDENDWRCQLRAMLRHTSVLQQEFVSGVGWGIELLYRRGEMVWHFCHERLHEGSGTSEMGGGSSYRRSATPPAEILSHSRRLLDSLCWHGVAMVEFKRANNGDFKLMEINPRLWGSLALAIDAGVDFPYGLLCLAAEIPVPSQPYYRVPYYTRALTQDVEWLREWLGSRPVFSGLVEIVRLGRPLLGIESWDHFDWADPIVTLSEVGNIVSTGLRRVWGKVSNLWIRPIARRCHKTTFSKMRRSKRKPRRILFLCNGNTCRSPLAQLLARRLISGTQISSAGFYKAQGRPVPENILWVAESLGLDLTKWSSKRVTRGMVEAADLVILMDLQNFRTYVREFPTLLDRVTFLGMFLDRPTLVIADPYQASADEALRVSKQIEAAVSRLAALVVPDEQREAMTTPVPT